MTKILLTLPLLLLLASPALAQDHVKWSKSLEAAIQEAKERGSMIFIAMTINDEVANDNQMLVYRDPAFVKASADFVCLFCNPMANKGEVEMVIDGVKQKCSAIAPGIGVRDHMKAWTDVLKNYAELNTNSIGETGIPFHFAIDAKGVVLDTIANGTAEGGFDVVGLATFVSKFRELIAKHGKGLTQQEFDELSGMLASGEEKLAAKDYPGALTLFRGVVAKNSTTRLADQARVHMETISAHGAEGLKAAEALIEPDPLAALVKLQEIAGTYAGTETGKRAASLLKQLETRPEVKAAAGRLKAEREARKLLEKAETAKAAKDYARAVAVFEDVAKKFPDTTAGEEAKASAAELRDDPEIGKLLLEQEAAKVCKGWLSMGRSFAQNGMADKAREMFQKIVEKYPGTSYAEEARKELAKLR